MVPSKWRGAQHPHESFVVPVEEFIASFSVRAYGLGFWCVFVLQLLRCELGVAA